MASATLYPSYHAPIPGLKKGELLFSNSSTTTFGLSKLYGAVIMPKVDSSTQIVSMNLNATYTNATLNLTNNKGAASTTAIYGYYIAWGEGGQ